MTKSTIATSIAIAGLIVTGTSRGGAAAQTTVPRVHRVRILLPRGFGQTGSVRRAATPHNTVATARTQKQVATARRVDPEGPLQRALDQVNLTPDEKDKIAALSAKADTDGKAAYADRRMTTEQYQARMAAIDAEYRKGIEDALSPSQRDRFRQALSVSKWSGGRKQK